MLGNASVSAGGMEAGDEGLGAYASMKTGCAMPGICTPPSTAPTRTTSTLPTGHAFAATLDDGDDVTVGVIVLTPDFDAVGEREPVGDAVVERVPVALGRAPRVRLLVPVRVCVAVRDDSGVRTGVAGERGAKATDRKNDVG